jgi:hypothetical protein
MFFRSMQVTMWDDMREMVYERGRIALGKRCILLVAVGRRWMGLNMTRNDLRLSGNVKTSREGNG